LSKPYRVLHARDRSGDFRSGPLHPITVSGSLIRAAKSNLFGERGK
jgi:hypothetical protein